MIQNTYAYDSGDRLKSYTYLPHNGLAASVTYGNGAKTGYTYDKKYRVTAQSCDGQTLWIAYDGKNRVESVLQKVDSHSVETRYLYGEAARQQSPGLIMGLEVNGTRRVTYTYDRLARVKQSTLELDQGKKYPVFYNFISGMHRTISSDWLTVMESRW